MAPPVLCGSLCGLQRHTPWISSWWDNYFRLTCLTPLLLLQTHEGAASNSTWSNANRWKIYKKIILIIVIIPVGVGFKCRLMENIFEICTKFFISFCVEFPHLNLENSFLFLCVWQSCSLLLLSPDVPLSLPQRVLSSYDPALASVHEPQTTNWVDRIWQRHKGNHWA